MYILDTNILLDNHKNIFELNDNIIIPITVIKELEKYKNEKSDRGYHARKSIKIIDKILDNDNIIEDNKIIIDSNDYNDIKNNDDKILQSVIDNESILITNDLALKIKAKLKNCNVINIKRNDYPVGQIKYIDTSKEIIDIVNNEGWIQDYLIEEDDDYQNQCYVLKNGSQSTLARKVNSSIIKVNPPNSIFNVIKPNNVEQKFYADMLLDPDIKIVICASKSGSGKSLLALAAGLQLINTNKAKMNKIMCFKPIVSVGEDIGFLPGRQDQKIEPFYQAFNDNLEYIRDELNIESYYEKGFTEVEFGHIGSIRGRSICKSFIILEEMQNTNNVTAKSCLSRAGIHSKVVMLGDLEQIDNKNSKYDNGLYHTQQKLINNKNVGIINLEKIERSLIAELADKL